MQLRLLFWVVALSQGVCCLTFQDFVPTSSPLTTEDEVTTQTQKRWQQTPGVRMQLYPHSPYSFLKWWLIKHWENFPLLFHFLSSKQWEYSCKNYSLHSSIHWAIHLSFCSFACLPLHSLVVSLPGLCVWCLPCLPAFPALSACWVKAKYGRGR